jgi:hypothetical protein
MVKGRMGEEAHLKNALQEGVVCFQNKFYIGGLIAYQHYANSQFCFVAFRNG